MPSGHVDTTKPLKLLSDHAWSILRYLDNGQPMVRHEINAGVWDRLLRESLVEEQSQGRIRVMVITAAGRAKLAAGVR